MIFNEHEYPQHAPAGQMSQRGFSGPYVKHHFALVEAYVDASEDSNFSTEMTHLVLLRTWRYP